MENVEKPKRKLSKKMKWFLYGSIALLFIVIIANLGGGDDKSSQTKIKHDKVYVIATLVVIDGQTPINFEIVETWNEEMGIYANIAIAPNTSKEELLSLLKIAREVLKDEKWVDLNVFDNIAAADNYFSKIIQLNAENKTAEEDKLFAHYKAILTKNPTTGLEEVLIKEGDDWVKMQ